MIIVYLIGRFPPVYGGGGNVEIARNIELLNRGHKIYFMTPRYDKSHLSYENYMGIHVYRVYPALEGALSSIFYVLNSFIKILRFGIHPDLIIDVIPYSNPLPFIRLFSKLLHAPVIGRTTQTGANEPLASQGGKFGFFRKLFFDTYEHTIAISPDLVTHCMSGGIPENRVTLIPDCVDTDYFSPIDEADKEKLRNKLFPKLEGEIVSIVGNVSQRKRSHLAIEAWKALQSKYTKPVTLIFIGPIKSSGHPFDEDYVHYIRSKIIEYDLEDSVLFTGFQKNINEYFKISDITLFVSEREGLPGVVLQSLSTGVPIVTTNIEKVTEYMLTDNVEGFITSDEPAEIADRMIDLLSDQELRKKMGLKGRKNVINRFGIKKNTDAIEELFNNVIRKDICEK